ncbi:alcohol oxidase [Aspergillus ellipticus CBS 707.79]|uniref:glucose oxidase n=1 Tax=Aspergillus ellipticus CBS 707.79 TaxID=1448320 RepID=A0A319DT98_9EURO|nr:alcohol oxidase [Aspergillus ellipticus CBS 707.79]
MLRSLTLLGALSALASAATPEYDYVIIGGGTSGLVVANRLSENPDVSVLVIEAGDSVYDNYNVTDVDGYGLAFGTDIDWQYETVLQPYAGNVTQVLRAGKALSGTSAINGMAYTRAEDVQIDAWQAIGNEGWTWDSLLPYYLKSENLTAPTTAQAEAGATFDAAVNGEDGPLAVGWPELPLSNLTSTVNATFAALGVPWTADVNGGKMRGFNVFPSTIDYAEYVREDAARAYYFPFDTRANLHVLLNTFANRIVWSDAATAGDHVTAAGVEITYANGTTSVVGAREEVIVSAGSLKSPAILELSGVGNPAVLEPLNITVKVDLPTVGENLQDQTNAGAYANATSDLTGGKTVAYPNVYDVYGNETSAVARSVRHQLRQWARETAEVSSGTMTASDLEALFQVQYDLIFTDKAPIAEILYYPGGGNELAVQFWGLLPFARGTVHIASADPTTFPTIDPNYWKFDWDIDSTIAIAKYIRKTLQTAPLKDLIAVETSPGAAVATDAEESVWEDWLLTEYRSNFHPVGTAAMMPKAKGGVVSEQLTVYGTSNVRVVDASVLPFQVCGHLTSTLYAVAERASDLIKAESSLF